MDPEAIHIASPQQAPEEKTGIINKLPRPKKPNLLIVILVIIGVFALGTIIYFANQIKNLKKETSQSPQLQTSTGQANDPTANWKTYSVNNCGKLLPDPKISFSIPSSWKSSFEEKDYFAHHTISGRGGEKFTLTCGDGLGGGCSNWGEIELGNKRFPACHWERNGIVHISNIGGTSNTIGFDLHVQYHANDKEAEETVNKVLSTFRILSDEDVPETGPHTYCDSNADCWCRNFNGAKFLQGRVQGVCNLEANTCLSCFYE